MNFLPALLLLSLTLDSSDGLRCIKCERSECTPPPRRCVSGVVLDVCQCCKVCAKGCYEECGGPWNIHGVCGTGLSCFPEGFQTTGICLHNFLVEKLQPLWNQTCKTATIG
ncbi:hypothetical protein Pmani_004959 [Petrolisthes manimaculis]|uniref:IGFBP N-terminal domain-containing protein n=1 Tax=Petrolisthes manimaculis TaxID=1843537 RepID=A0AAE1QCM7_9EUCA|nr:hypothetical protein Pmani_004959 [Petrolisthes manimaculis]